MSIEADEIIKQQKEKIRRLQNDIRLIRGIVNGKMEPGFVDNIRTICAKALGEKG